VIVLVSQIVKESIAEAKNWIDRKDNPDTDPVICFNMVDGILSNLKSFVHDQVIWDTIDSFEKRIHNDFQSKLTEARSSLEQEDPMFAWEKGLRFYIDLRTWKSQELLSFYDRLSKEHDI